MSIMLLRYTHNSRFIILPGFGTDWNIDPWKASSTPSRHSTSPQSEATSPLPLLSWET
ncbi:hypothetical protein EMPG_14697 [Blastomyces silverae]|uniref:Uncharacterized protein n=1 Tax=Blastomyces silverae TaxID=2060906 RepID=A0A0H1BFU2_9EURO|nr:hypothetical protein EMPG_14697 [Blastomyces silverae]